MFNTFDFDEVDPSEKTRIIELDNGVVIKATQEDPYGFWKLRYTKGATPDVLSGSFTTFEAAKNEIKNYCNSAGYKMVQVKRGGEPALEPGATKKDIYDPPKPRFKKQHDSISLE
jgi:hypothetical protein